MLPRPVDPFSLAQCDIIIRFSLIGTGPIGMPARGIVKKTAPRKRIYMLQRWLQPPFYSTVLGIIYLDSGSSFSSRIAR